ncbi:hypothetical protein [Caldimonas brevitalea]|uniref:Beta-barrel porin 2 n=1 Tax=Caldimonas brevitalea TaxID=413882 RepID=A0A0G3BET8_9BURK|nr:hypothetical protein [Caldimonas brevitalea]AKJ27934.1 hypothetical protein AAW51_1243 [Caldimonas brevitalea]
MSHLPVRRLPALQLTVAAASVLVAFGASADPNPYYLRAKQAFTRESNVYRNVESAEKSDTSSASTLSVGLDQPIGRQRLLADAYVKHTNYHDESHLDNTGYGLNVRAALETVNRLSGGLNYSTSRGLASFESGTATSRVTEKNMVSQQMLGGQARLGMASLWVLETGYTWREQEYSAQAFQPQEQESHMFNVGARYRPTDLISFGVAVRHTDGRIPNFRPGVEDKYDRDDLDFTVSWRPNGLSNFDARLSRTRTDHELVDARDFKGFTGSLAYRYRPTGKLSFNAAFVRETDDETGAFTIPGLPEEFGDAQLPVQNTTQINSYRFGIGYQATAKIRLNLGLRQSRRKLEESFPTGQSGRDRTNVAGLGLDYNISRNWLAGCNYNWEKRRVSSDNRNFSFPYKAESVGCMAQFALQ